MYVQFFNYSAPLQIRFIGKMHRLSVVCNELIEVIETAQHNKCFKLFPHIQLKNDFMTSAVSRLPEKKPPQQHKSANQVLSQAHLIQLIKRFISCTRCA